MHLLAAVLKSCTAIFASYCGSSTEKGDYLARCQTQERAYVTRRNQAITKTVAEICNSMCRALTVLGSSCQPQRFQSCSSARSADLFGFVTAALLGLEMLLTAKPDADAVAAVFFVSSYCCKAHDLTGNMHALCTFLLIHAPIGNAALTSMNPVTWCSCWESLLLGLLID